MKRKLKWYIASLLLLFTATVVAQNTDEDWEEVHREGNVVFLVQNNASRITKIVNTVLKVKNLNDHKVFIQFTPVFYCEGESGDALPKEQESTYLGFGEEGNASLHAFKVCKIGKLPLVKIDKLIIHETNELDAAKRIKH